MNPRPRALTAGPQTPRGVDTALMDTLTPRQKLAIKSAIVGVAVAVALALVLATPFITPESLPDDMDPAAPQRCVGIFVVCVSLWFTNLQLPRTR